MKYNNTEELFVDIMNKLIQSSSVVIPMNDKSAITHFIKKISNKTPFTFKQSRLLMQLLTIYTKYVCKDTAKLIPDHVPVFTLPLFEIKSDLLMYLETGEDSKWGYSPTVVFVISRQYIKRFFHYVETFCNSLHDLVKILPSEEQESTLIKCPYWAIDIGIAYEFCVKNGFTISDEITECLAEYNDAWNNIDTIKQYSIINSNKIELCNAPETAVEWFNKNSTSNQYYNMLLAKSMGFPLSLLSKPFNTIELIASSDYNTFWTQDYNHIFELYKLLACKIAVICTLDDYTNRIISFVNNALATGIAATDIKIGCRDDIDVQFNDWIKSYGMNGNIESGNICIFKTKPPKWIFNKKIKFDIVIVDALYTPLDHTTNAFLESSPCVIYLNEIKPTILGNKNLVTM